MSTESHGHSVPESAIGKPARRDPRAEAGQRRRETNRRLKDRRKEAKARARARRDEARRRESERRLEEAEKRRAEADAMRAQAKPDQTQILEPEPTPESGRHAAKPTRPGTREAILGLAVAAVVLAAAGGWAVARNGRVNLEVLGIGGTARRQGGIGLARTGFIGARAFGDLERQVSFGPRVPGTKAHDKAIRYLAEELAATQWRVRRDRFAQASGTGETLHLTNIRARHPKQRAGGKPVLLLAHLDSRPRADRERDAERRRRPVPGANDGASGCAVLLEASRRIAAEPDAYLPVEIALVDGEDWPERWVAGQAQGVSLFGSKRLGEEIAAAAKMPYRWAIVVDMVGDKNLRLLREGHSIEASSGLVDRIWRIGQSAAPASFDYGRGPSVTDDHLPLIAAGLPTCLLTDLDYAAWHTLDDTPEQTSAASLAQVGTALLLALRLPGT